MREEIIKLIKEAGVVGAGGAGFPTHVKVNAQADHVIVNGAECEPLLRVDQQLMDLMAKEMVQGLESVMMATGASMGTIALKGKYQAAIASLEKEITGKPIKIFILGDFYPAGDEHVTVYEVTGKIIPEGQIPLKVGCVVSNVETLINVARAKEGTAVTDTYVTLTGDVPEPLTVKLPIGISIAEALSLAGQINLQDKLVIDGGPMMGPVVEDFTLPITKLTKGLIVLPLDHALISKRSISLPHIIKQAKTACIQCVRCTDMCPRHMLGHKLKPHLIMRGLNYFEGDQEVMKMALACTECGACEYACNMMLLSPRRVNALLKEEFAKNGIKADPSKEDEKVVPTREYMKIPSKRLVGNLGLAPFDRPAPLREVNYQPQRVSIPLKQHIGQAAAPVVKEGQWVEKGTLIGSISEGAMGAQVHASISGRVEDVNGEIVIVAAGAGGGKS